MVELPTHVRRQIEERSDLEAELLLALVQAVEQLRGELERIAEGQQRIADAIERVSNRL